jgi:ribosome-binding factor A
MMSQEECVKNIKNIDVFVRNRVVRNINIYYLPQMMHDKDDFIRREVARRINILHLPQMINDESSFVRLEVLQRISIADLPKMMYDKDWFVRFKVAQRIDKRNALLMSGIDENEKVRKIALENALGLL